MTLCYTSEGAATSAGGLMLFYSKKFKKFYWYLQHLAYLWKYWWVCRPLGSSMCLGMRLRVSYFTWMSSAFHAGVCLSIGGSKSLHFFISDLNRFGFNFLSDSLSVLYSLMDLWNMLFCSFILDGKYLALKFLYSLHVGNLMRLYNPAGRLL